MAATAAPGIQFKVGQSLSELSALGRELGVIRKQLQGIRQDAQQAASGLNQINGGLVNRHGQPLRPPEPPAAPTPPAGRQPKAPAANADRNLFAGMMGSTGMSDAEWKELGKKQAKRREEALKAGMELNPTERKEFGRTRAVNAAMRARTGEDVQGLLAKGLNALSWSPFMPQSFYYGQMALEGLGLGAMPMAAILGGLGLGAGGLAANAALTTLSHTGNQLVSQTGAPPFLPNTYVTGAAESNLLTQRTGARGLNLPDKTGPQAVSALAAGGLSSSDAFGRSLDETAALINAFGMSVQDAAGMVTTWRTDMRMSDDQVTAALASLAKVAEATGMPLSALGQIVDQTPNLLANLSGDPSQYGQAAAVLRALGGTTQGAIQLGGIANASGGPALSLAAQMHVSDQEFNALQGTAAGQQRIDDFIVGLVKQSMQQTGGAVDQAMLMVNGRLQSNFDKATFLRLNNLPANATAAAVQAASQAPGASGTGSADAFIKALAAGNPAAAALLANPPNVKDVTLNASQVFLTGALNQLGTALGVSTNANGYDVATLRRIAAQGGVAGIAATAALVGRGQTTTTPPSAAMQAIQAAGVNLPPSQYPLQAPPSPPGNGGGGQVITINLQTDGRQIAQLPVKIGPNQQFHQYVPRYHAPGRGPQ